jgi:hypothetical protein
LTAAAILDKPLAEANMPKVVLYHGYGETPTTIWFPYIKEALEPRGCSAIYHKLPHPMTPTYAEWMAAALPRTDVWDEQTIVIGHSIGGVLALRLLECPQTPAVRALITVGSPIAWLEGYDFMGAFIEGGWRTRPLRRKAERFIIVHALDDEIVSLKHAESFTRMLHGELNVVPQGGHFTDIEAPAVLETIERLLDNLS